MENRKIDGQKKELVKSELVEKGINTERDQQRMRKIEKDVLINGA